MKSDHNVLLEPLDTDKQIPGLVIWNIIFLHLLR